MKRKSAANSVRERQPNAEEKCIRLSTALSSSAANSVLMLDRCLLQHDIGLENHRSILKDVVKELAFLLPKEQIVPQNMLQTTAYSENQTEAEEEEAPIAVSQKQRSSSKSKSSSSKKPTDDHNELCEICDLGGDLLCCDTCTLVFHKKCLRPAVSSLPKGKWSCPYCVVDGLCDGNPASAKNSIARMRLLSCGFDYVDEFKEETRFCHDVSIVRSNRMYVSRKVVRGLLVEYGRYNELDEAVLSLLQKEDDEEPDPTCEELWCTECLDNPAIEVCLFCGCKVCLGKFDSTNLLICDGCEEETHTYCLATPLVKIPESAWFCTKCVGKNIDAGANVKKESSRSTKASRESNDNATNAAEDYNKRSGGSSAVTTTTTATGKRDGRGRPPLQSTTTNSAAKTSKDVNRRQSSGSHPQASESIQSSFQSQLYHQLSKFECTNDEAMKHIIPRGIVGAKDVVAIIKKMAFRELTHDEKRCLNYYRDWALASDIEGSLVLLKLIRDSIAKKVSDENLNFELTVSEKAKKMRGSDYDNKVDSSPGN